MSEAPEATAALAEPLNEGPAFTVGKESGGKDLTRILALPRGQKLHRRVPNLTPSHVSEVLKASETERGDFVSRFGFGFGDLLTPAGSDHSDHESLSDRVSRTHPVAKGEVTAHGQEV